MATGGIGLTRLVIPTSHEVGMKKPPGAKKRWRVFLTTAFFRRLIEPTLKLESRSELHLEPFACAVGKQ